MADSPFLLIDEDAWVASNEMAFALRDAYPVTDGHTLIVTRRLVETWWDATPAERDAVMALVHDVKSELDRELRPDGYNVGFNNGAAAGQTVSHLHVHVIPRYVGDMADPRGGVRHVIPSRGNYLVDDVTPETPDLVDGLTGSLLPHLLTNLRDPSVDRIDIVVSFVRRSGLELVLPDLLDALDRGAGVRLLTTDYLGITEPAALEELFDLLNTHRDRGSISVRVFRDRTTSFHPKAFLFSSSAESESPRTFVGSSNLTRSGLDGGIEWSAYSPSSADAQAAFERIWSDKRSVGLDRAVLDDIAAQPRPAPVRWSGGVAAEDLDAQYDAADDVEPVEPNGVQVEALAALDATRAAGHRAGLVVMATGLGKTYLAAFDVRAMSASRVLFVAHRKEILEQARGTFRRVLPESRFGLLVDGQDDSDSPILFASIQSLATRLDTFASDAFDYIVVDEFHHAAADTYRRILDHFEPSFLLGLTATPDRLDGGDILALCGDNEVFRCDLVAGIDRDLLAPFHYHGVLDPTDYTVVPWRRGRFQESALEEAVATDERAQVVFDEWSARHGRRTLAFCVSQIHADFMAEWFRAHGIRAVSVHSGPTSAPRNESVRQLTEGELDVLFSVDVFNEGFDVPAIDTVLMLRPTESPIIFLQQLGRGLRIADDKDHLTVVDLIGNHESFLLKPRILLTLGLGRTPSTGLLTDAMKTLTFPLPDGCAVDFQVEVIDLLLKLSESRTSGRGKAADLVRDYILDHVAEEGTRPTKVQVLRAGLNPDASRQPWFEYLAGLDVLDGNELAALATTRQVLGDLERKVLANLSKSYKPVTLRAMIVRDGLRDGLAIDDLVDAARRLMVGDPRLQADAAETTFDPDAAGLAAWRTLWFKNPINALSTSPKTAPLFAVENDRFVPTFRVPEEHHEAFTGMFSELVDCRLAKYLIGQSEGYVLKVSNAGDKPIIRFDRAKHPRLPSGDAIPFEADGTTYLGDFRKIALNVARLEGSSENDLHALLRGWFGENAGAPGTAHQVVFKDTGSAWEMSPAVGRAGGAWSDEQVEHILDHYFEMLDAELAGEPYSKAEHNRALQQQIGRSKGSIEFKMANVSAALDDLGQPFIDGYKPRGNYQAALRAAIEKRIS